MKSLPEAEKGISILVLDAGSPSGVLSEMHVLEELMCRLASRLGRKGDLFPSDYFDLIGGSGIGAFAALCIGPLEMSAAEAIEALQILGASVFYENINGERRTVFDSDELRDTVRGIIEGTNHSPDAMIGNIAPKSQSKAVFFVSPVIDIASCHRLRSYRGRKGMLQCTVLEVALACISTLGLFDHAEIGTGRRKYTSAGMYHTNPIKDVLDEAEQIFGAEQRVSCIISLGAGTRFEGSISSDLTRLEVHGLLQAMEMQQKLVTEEAARQFASLEAYYRFSIDGIGSGSLMDWMHLNADLVESHTQNYLANSFQSAELDAAVHQLDERYGSITLNNFNHASGVTVTAKIVPPVTQFFILREKSWAFIKEKLARASYNERTVFVLSGLGGSGKSTLFSYYVQTFGSKYSHIFLIDASSVQSIKTDLQNAVRSLGPEHSQKTWEEALQYLSKPGPNQNWLIGFDNADDVELPLQAYIPEGEHGTIFITTRNRDLCFLTSGSFHWELGPMTEEEALDALLRSAQRPTPPSYEDLRDGATLAERLGRLPLALIQAGVFCSQRKLVVDVKEVPFTFAQYLDEMDKNHSDLMSHSAAQSLDQYDKSVYQSLNMSYSALPQSTRDFLHLCGYFHHSNIPLLMLESAVDGRFVHPPNHNFINTSGDKRIKEKLTSLLEIPGKTVTIHLHKIIFSLRMYSLVVTSMTPYSVMLNFHALVNTWSRDVLSASDQKLYSAMATRVVATCGDPKYYPVHSSLLPHIQELVSQSKDLSYNDMATFAERLRLGGLAAEAELLYWRLYTESSNELGKHHKIPLLTFHNLADSIRYQGRFEEATKLQKEALEMGKKVYLEEDGYTHYSELNLAANYLVQRRYLEADEILRRLYSTAMEEYGKGHETTLAIMQNLSISHLDQGRVREAAKMQEEILELRRRMLGRDHPDISIMMINLAASYIKLKRYDDAERLEKEALEMLTRTNGKEHPDTLLAMSNLANTRNIQGNPQDAVILAEQALDGYRKVFGSSHPDTCRSMCVLGKIYLKLERMTDAIRIKAELRRAEGPGGVWSTSLAKVLLG